jgi:hypothetical protein
MIESEMGYRAANPFTTQYSLYYNGTKALSFSAVLSQAIVFNHYLQFTPFLFFLMFMLIPRKKFTLSQSWMHWFISCLTVS